MSQSYQHEVPQARVSITLDVETGGAKSRKELPMKLLMLGDFTHGQTHGPVAHRERVNINKHNFDQVLSDLSPQLRFSVANKVDPEQEELEVNVTLKQLSDFKPDRLVEQVPALKRLMAMRNLLKDLKSNVIDNHMFRKELEKILKNESDTKQLLQELKQTAPLTSY